MSTNITKYSPSENNCNVSIDDINSINADEVPRNTYIRVRLRVFCITYSGTK